MRYFFRVEYDGTRYGGWQRQTNAVSIQELLEKALSTILRAPVAITGAGRTDAGVHARGQCVHFDAQSMLDIRRCELALNAVLPPDIAVYGLRTVPESFHARFSAISRRYRYSICERKCPLRFKRVWMMFYEVNWEQIGQNLESLQGTHDFAAFCASGSGSDNCRCTVKRASVEQCGDLRIITIEADRFIYKMVRSVVGTLIDIGRGRLDSPILDILESKDRRRVGATAPPCGLVLDEITYQEFTNAPF